MSPAPDPSKPIFVHNTLTRQREELVPLVPGRIGMYNCGPTVYDHFHVGNARNFVCADTIRRYLAWRGYEVKFVQNITDIDDKIINRAREAGCSAAELAEKFTKVFFESSEKLGVRPADHHPRATQYVGKMIGFMKRLEKAGYTYTAEGDLYFRVRRFEGYGKLSGRRLDDMRAGTRVEVSDKKEDPADFVLWKAAKEGEPSWPSPWGPGRPGWHSECCVMSSDLLGETFDIHMGGIDLVFPHHENEIAQNEALLGKPFVRYWLHNGFLNVNGEKMSKSLGNFFTIDQVLAKFEAPVVRYFLLSAHYRVPLDFSDGALSEAAVALGRLREARRTVRRLTAGRQECAIRCATLSGSAEPLPEAVRDIYVTFQTAMDDDFNTPRALAALFEAATRINQCDDLAMEMEKTGRALDEADVSSAALLGKALDELAGEVLGLELEALAATENEPLIKKEAGGVCEQLSGYSGYSGVAGSLVDRGTHGYSGHPGASSTTQIKEGTGFPGPTASTPELPPEVAEKVRILLQNLDNLGAKEVVDQMLAIRKLLRDKKQYVLADTVREALGRSGIDIRDRPGGVSGWEPRR